MLNRILNLIVSIFLGSGVAIVGGFLQATKIKLFLTIPWGFVLYVFLLFSTIIFIRNQHHTRLNLVSYFLGWLVITLLMSMKSKAGDLVLTNNLTALIYILGSVIIISAALVLPLKKTK